MIIKMKIKNTKEIEEKTFKLLKELSIKANEEKKYLEVRQKINLNTKKIKLYAY